jgi:hypothetical protein
MQISVKRTGGYAGLSEQIVNLDTSKLNPNDARTVKQAIDTSNFYAVPETVEASVGADLLKYEITITDGAQRRTVTFADDGQPQTAQLVELVNRLVAIR